MGLDIFANELMESNKGKIIQLHGNFDDATSMQFSKFMESFIDEHKPEVVVLDCKKITSFNSKALTAVSTLYKNLKILKKGLILARVSRPMVPVIEDMKFHGNIPTYNELERAIEIAYYFIEKKSQYNKRKFESIRETPVALKRDEEFNK
ncbi:MAG: STAS domain-containing protein, partial [Planctomycetes bacterium]|nr:STAS domain-containing protein [Planctomycetota bacterium]